MGAEPPGTAVSYLLASAKELGHEIVWWISSVVRHAIVVFGGAVVTFAIFVTEHQRGEAYSWRAAEWIIGSAFLVAFFLAWREKYRAWRDQCVALALERENKLPELFAYIRYIGKGKAPNDDTPLFLAQIEIRNDGFPSVVKDFCPAVTLDGHEFLGRLAEAADTVRLTMPNGIVKTFHEKDALYNVTKTPIQPGDLRSGHLHFYFDRAIGYVDKHRVKIYFRDYRNTTFSTEPIDDKDTVSAQTLPHPGGMFSREQFLPVEDNEEEGGSEDG